MAACEVCKVAYGEDWEGWDCEDHTQWVITLARRLATSVNGELPSDDVVVGFLDDAIEAIGRAEVEPPVTDLGWHGGIRYFVIGGELWRTPDANVEGPAPMERAAPDSVLTQALAVLSSAERAS